MFRLKDQPGRGSRSSTDGLITSFMGLFSLSPNEIQEITDFVKNYWGDDPPDLKDLLESNKIDYMAIYHLPVPSCEIIGVCTFR